MAIRIPLSFLDRLKNKCIFNVFNSFEKDIRTVKCFSIDKTFAKIPIRLYKDVYDSFPVSQCQKINITFNGKLYTTETDIRKRDQNIVVEKALEILKDNHSVLLSLCTGFGKTIIAIYLSCVLKLKTVILCHIQILHKYWKKEFETFTDAKVQIVDKDTLNPEADVYIIGILKTSSSTIDFSKIGLVIVDELHICTETCFNTTLLKFNPCYLVGLSATPRRLDGLECLYKPYFGDMKDFIVRAERKNLIVEAYFTNFKPEVSYMFYKGETKINWVKMINSIASNKERYSLITDIIRNHPLNKILVLSARNEECKGVYQKLKELNENVDTLYSTKMVYDENARILVAGMKKVGVGFNDLSFNMLVLCSDTTNITQYEGRIRSFDYIVCDIIDDHELFLKHWRARKKWYMARGANEIKEQTEKQDKIENIIPKDCILLK